MSDLHRAAHTAARAATNRCFKRPKSGDCVRPVAAGVRCVSSARFPVCGKATVHQCFSRQSVCVSDLHKPHYRQQQSCLGTKTACVCACVCLWPVLCSFKTDSKIWLTELARPITWPRSVQLLLPLFRLLAPMFRAPAMKTHRHLCFFFFSLQRNRPAHTAK